MKNSLSVKNFDIKDLFPDLNATKEIPNSEVEKTIKITNRQLSALTRDITRERNKSFYDQQFGNSNS